MGISGVSAAGSMPVGQIAQPQPVDSVSRNIQNEIMVVQQKMQKLSSDESISIEEKVKKRQEFQKEISSLNARLRQHQAELSQQQRKEALKAQSQEDENRDHAAGKGRVSGEKSVESQTEDDKASKAAGDNQKQTDAVQRDEEGKTQPGSADRVNTNKVDNGLSSQGMEAIASADASMERAVQQGAVVTRIEGGVVVLKAEISQDQARNTDVQYKEKELEEQEERARRAALSQGAVLGEANQTVRATAQDKQENAVKKTGIQPQANESNNVVYGSNFAEERAQEVSQQQLASAMNFQARIIISD